MDRMIYFYIGIVPMFILYMLVVSKKVRSNYLIKILIAISVPIAIPGIFIKVPEAGWLFGAFVYITSYTFFRYLYLLMYNKEPTYYRAGWYDPEEGRKQNWFDVFVFVFPLMLSLVIPIIITIFKSKTLYN